MKFLTKLKKINQNLLVINADDILINPIISMKKLCKKLNINFSKKMLNWPKGKRDTDGIWSKVWYKNVEQSTTFNKYKNEYIVFQKIFKNL